MPSASNTPHDMARKAHATVLRAMAEPGTQVCIAATMGASESTVSRLKNEHLESFCLLLSCLGLKLVPADMQCFHPAKIQALLTLARDHLVAMEHPEQLVWD